MYVANNYVSSVQDEITISDSYIETISVEDTVNARKYLFLCIYRSPSGNINNFLNTLTDILSLVNNNRYQGIYIYRYQGIYIFGDFNINLLKNKENYFSEFINLMYTWFQLVTSTSAHRPHMVDIT